MADLKLGHYILVVDGGRDISSSSPQVQEGADLYGRTVIFWQRKWGGGFTERGKVTIV